MPDIPIQPSQWPSSRLAGGNNGGRSVVVYFARAGTGSLNSFNNLHRLVISDLTENNVLAIEPASHRRRDEKLRAISVRSRIGHGEESRAGVALVEVLICELLSVNRLASSAIAASEVTSLKHECGNHTVELGILEAKALLAGAEATEVLHSFGNDTLI